MQTIITPRNIVDTLFAHDGESASFKPWNNSVQKWLIIAASVSLVLGALLALISKQTVKMDVRWWALGSLVFSQLTAVLYQLTVIIPGIRTIWNPTKTISDLAAERFDQDVQTITLLAKTFDQHHLDYARDHLTQLVAQLRFRIGFLIGAIDKVGVLPGAIAGYVYATDILKRPDLSTSGIEWAFAALVAFYLIAVALLTVSQRVEHASLIAAHAATKKANDAKVFSSAKGG
jgi:hypothetical protein